MAYSVFLAVSLVVPAFADFDAQRAAMKDTMKTQPESAVMSLLEAGLAEGKAAVAIAEIRKWLAQNRPENNALLFHAGRAAELSGNWKDAVSLYQQYLEGAELSSAQADEAVFAVYVLLIERLKDEGAAYNFSRNEGDRLMVCPRARQFDKWFLDKAIDRNRSDVLAVAKRLNACIEAGIPETLLIARYDNYFRWLLNTIDVYAKDKGAQINKPTADAIKQLTDNMNFFEELKLRLNWAANVLYYIQSRLDGNDTPAPIAEASALLEKYPKYAKWVQTGWGGGRDGDVHSNYVGDYDKYWAHELDAKMAPVVKAAASLDASRLTSLVATWDDGYYHRQRQKPSLGSLQCVSDFLGSRDPQDVNPYVSPLSKSWKEYSVDEARQLAPEIETNRHRDTSIIRAIAVGGKDYGKVMEALRGPELWRLQAVDLTRANLTDELWHYCGRPGGNEKKDEERRKSRNIGEEQESVSITVDSPRKDRLRAFERYWDDYNAAMPTVPDVESKLRKVLRFTPEVVPVLLKSDSLHAQAMLRGIIRDGMNGPGEVWEEIKDGRSVNVWQYGPSILDIARRHARNNLDELKKKHPNKYVMHPLEDAFRKAIKAGLKAGELASWKVIAWVNMQCPDKNIAQRELAGELRTSNIWDTLSFEARFAIREWFRKDGMSAAEAAWIDAANARLACEKLVGLSETSDVSATIAALQEAITGTTTSPTRFHLAGMQNLGIVPLEVFRDERVSALVFDVLEGLRYRSMDEHQKLGDRIYALIKKDMKDPVVIQRIGSYVAHYGARGSRGGKYKDLVPIIESLLETQPESASILAQNAVVTFSKAPNIYGFSPNARVQDLKSLAAKAAMRLGLFTIPVPRNHPAYPIYKAQADWLTGNEDRAWIAIGEDWEELLSVHRKLSVEFLMWALQRTIYSRDDEKQESLIKALQTWAGEENTALSKERQVEIELAYGDIALQKGMLKEAHEIYKRTEQKEAYEGLLIQYEATLRKARVERLAKNFDGALNTLNELALERVPELWSRIHYAMAEVYYDMEEYIDANDQVSTILAREPEHADAKIMQGRLQLKRKKLMEATEVELGTISSQQTLVPGEKLKVTLTDPTLAISGAGTKIEVAVWATSGDRELIFLRQFGDQKTKFRGEVPTLLGAPAEDDGVLQVIGDDEVFYAYSERFRQTMNNMEEKRGGPITIASDALLMASGRRLLTEAEQRVADMEAQMKALKGSAGAVKATMAADAEQRMMQGETIGGELTRTEIQSRLKPGNPLHVRVIDHDASRTADIDEVAVSVSTSSGDGIGRMVLKETGTHTGWFEGEVPTAGAQAMAYAQNSEPGRNPNMVISPKTDYPPWQPVPTSGNVPALTIDLNDNVPLGTMTLTASASGSKLKSFVLETGMNNRNMNTVAIYPKNRLKIDRPWQPSVTVLNDTDHHHRRNDRSVYDLREIQHHLERGWISQQYAAGIAENVKGPSVAMTSSIPAKVEWKRQNRHHNAHVIYRFRGYFYEAGDVTRRFKVELGKWEPPKVHGSVSDPAQYMLAVDGRIISERREKPPKAGAAVTLNGEINLRKGLHRFEIWSTGWDCRIGFGRSVEVLANLGADGRQLVPCPDDFFAPETFPADVLPHRNRSATITANGNGSAFTVKFAPDSKARLLRLLFVDQQGPVPVVNKITLQQPDGETVLPVKQDYAELNKNETLEILTGDNVAVRYVDDRYVSKTKETHERFLNVAFSDAVIAFQFHEMRKNRRQEMEPYYERQLRFVYGKPVYLSVFDPDMDVSAGLDTVPVTVQVEGGDAKTFTATEDELEPGTFRVQLTPVAGPATAAHEIAVPEGGQLTAVYRDAENTNPGVATDRYAKIKHATFAAPILRLSDSDVAPIDFESLAYPLKPRPLNPGFEKMDFGAAETEEASLGLARPKATDRPVSGTVMPQWRIVNSLHDADKPPAGEFHAVHGQMMYIELEAPHLALRNGSTVNIYAQTQAGRSAMENTGGDSDRKAFDVSVPGTIKLQGGLTQKKGHGNVWRATPKIPIYIGGESPSKNMMYVEPEERVFVSAVPLIAGMLPENGVMNLTRKERYDLGIPEKHGLVVRPDENIYVGMRYENEAGAEQWITGQASVITHPVFDVMADDYRTTRKAAYVGENLYLRVVDLGGDVTDGSDTVEIKMQAKSGAKLSVTLLEVDNHSGIFKAALPLTYARRGGVPEDYDVLREGFPVVYGDLVGAVYVDASGQKAPIKTIRIRKGADGSITPFSKQYEDQEMAMRTQFALAEAYLEMAKHHRKRGEEKEARREYDQARRLLASVIDQFTDPDTRSHAEFLLGNLTQEEADATDPGELQQKRYRAALARFMRVTGSYPDTRHASMAQFKIATVYEKLGEPDIAAQEYVKLAYKYPQSEFLALAMARLGAHFLRKASGYEKQANPLLAATDNKDAQFEGQAMQKMAVREYLNAGSIFSRMLERFPSHELAGKCGLRAGQAYMRAESTRQALNTFLQVVDTESYDGPGIRAQAMYWAGMCYERMREPMAAYAIYKRLTYDFPESKWAAYARGQLSQERMLKLETNLEIERLEEEGQ